MRLLLVLLLLLLLILLHWCSEFRPLDWLGGFLGLCGTVLLIPLSCYLYSCVRVVVHFVVETRAEFRTLLRWPIRANGPLLNAS